MLCHIPHVLGKEHDWVVFLHGLGGNSNIFYKQIDEYKKHFNLMFVDLVRIAYRRRAGVYGGA